MACPYVPSFVLGGSNVCFVLLNKNECRVLAFMLLT
jgi:hypothetical protein